MNERSKEIMYAGLGVGLCMLVLGGSGYYTYLSQVEHVIEFKVFYVDCWDRSNKVETQVLTWGKGKFYFLGNWTGQFFEGETYCVTYVQQRGSVQRGYKDLIVLAWEEV